MSSPRTGGRRTFKRAEEIIDAAAYVFARLGYHGASTQDIADRLGIRQASLYYYFRSKESALEQVCARGVEGYLAAGQAAAEASGSQADRLRAIIRAHIEPMRERPDYVRVFLTLRRFLQGDARKRVKRIERRYERVIQKVVEQGISSGEFRDDLPARDVTLALLGACNAANLWQGIVAGMTVARAQRVVSTLVVDGLCTSKRGRHS
ncbi:MAG: TetR/AcrR family transcriptional regulator [Burkholderiaceae bacterium]|nr:TetR/AcrR family transcriptional regulator [Burkholderiaceae bacterium]